MIIFRFMSKVEFDLYNKGQILINNKDHSITSNTTSKGFCFMDCDDYSPEYAYEFLNGIVSDDICCQFEVNEKFLIESKGKYADPHGDFDTFTAYEYCCESYNNKDFKLVNYTTDINCFEKFTWKYEISNL